MKLTLTIDDELMSAAAELTGVQGKAEVLRHALKKLVERESAKRLAERGGTEPYLKPIPRRRLPATR